MSMVSGQSGGQAIAETLSASTISRRLPVTFYTASISCAFDDYSMSNRTIATSRQAAYTHSARPQLHIVRVRTSSLWQTLHAGDRLPGAE